jgi:hypothetical protein
MPFVAIIGGFWKLRDTPAEFNEAKKTASETGAALANAGLGLVVYFSNDESLEPHVVSGYVQALPEGAGKNSIRIRFAESQRYDVKFAEEDARRELFDYGSLFPGDDWEAPFYRSLVAADGVDAVLLMAGDQSVRIAGQIALARPLPTLAVDKFPGAARVIRTELALGMKDYPASATHSIEEQVAWLKTKLVARQKEQAEALVTREKEQAQARFWESEYTKITSENRRTYWAMGAVIAFLCILLIALAGVLSPRYFLLVMLAGLFAAGAAGALLWSVKWATEKTAPTTTLLLGGAAGLVAGLACLIPQWVAAIGKAEATEIGKQDIIQFASAALVALSAGVGFDSVFARLREQGVKVPITADGQSSASGLKASSRLAASHVTVAQAAGRSSGSPAARSATANMVDPIGHNQAEHD